MITWMAYSIRTATPFTAPVEHTMLKCFDDAQWCKIYQRFNIWFLFTSSSYLKVHVASNAQVLAMRLGIRFQGDDAANRAF